MRPKYAGLRQASGSERARIVERNRAELRERIAGILTPEQRARFEALAAEAGARQAPARGRVFLLDGQGRATPVAVRTGLTDGSFTEVAGDGLAGNERVIVGVAGASAPAGRPAGSAGPRLPL